MSDVAAEDLQATVAKDSQAKAAGVAAKDALDLHVTMAAVSLPSCSTQRRSCSRSPSSRDSSLLSMFSTHAAGLHSLSLVCKDQTSQHLASTLPSSVFVGGATGCGVLRASGGLYTLHGLASAPSLVHGGKGVDSAHARLRRPVLPDVGSSMSSLTIFVRRKIPIILYCAKKHRTTIKSALNLPKEFFCDDIRSSRLSQGVNHKKSSIFTQRSLSCCTVAKEPYD